MSRQAVAESATSTPTAPQAVSARVEVDPSFVTINAEGFAFRSVFVRLPEGAIGDDLKNPEIWRRVQNHPGKALRRHDHLYIVSYAEDFAADAIVTDASASAAVVGVGRIISFATRIRELFSDGKFQVHWYGNGFAVREISSGRRVTELRPNEALAVNDLGRLYPKPVA
jgi:hypothetical protein